MASDLPRARLHLRTFAKSRGKENQGVATVCLGCHFYLSRARLRPDWNISLMGFQKMPPVLDYILSSFLMGAGAGVWEQALRTHEDSMLAKSGEGTIQLVGSL